MFGLAAAGSLVALVIEGGVPTLPPDRASTLLMYLLFVTSVSWIGLWRYRYGEAVRWAAAASLGSIACNAVALDFDRPGPVLAGTLATLLWSGLLLRPRHNALLAASMIPLLLAHGAKIESAQFVRPDMHPLPMVVVLIYLAMPVALGIGIQRASDLLSHALLRRLERAHARHDRLSASLRKQTDALEASRAALSRARKLETVGTMASGLAHELNNILTPVRGLGELLASGLVSQEQAQLYGRRILKSAVAAGRITSSLLAYTWQGPFQPVRTNAREFLALELLPELTKHLPHGVWLDAELGDDIWIDVDRMQFQHCVTNLVLNAADAMPDGGPIHVTLETWSETNGVPPTHAQLVVRDHGTGIAPEHLEHIFDPFFTTKAIGAGTGLGLALVQGSVTRHGGTVLVDNGHLAAGDGTSFIVRLPLASGVGHERRKHKTSDDWDASGPTVLVVMEDPDELDELDEVLTNHDCAPLCCHEPNRAPALLGDMGSRVQVLVLDLEATTVDMRAMYATLRASYPKLPVILLSNEPTSPKNRALLGDHPTRSVRKPVDPSSLPALLQGLLTGRDAPGRKLAAHPAESTS